MPKTEKPKMPRSSKRRRKEVVASGGAAVAPSAEKGGSGTEKMSDDRGRVVEGYSDCSFYADQQFVHPACTLALASPCIFAVFEECGTCAAEG
jgi:hypothetical protein